MESTASKYALELYSRSGLLLADLSGRAKNRRLIKSRNEADEIAWEVDLAEFEAYCRRIGVNPRSLLVNAQTEVKIRRGQSYLSAGQVVYFEPRITSEAQVMSIRATGFFNLLQRRYIPYRDFAAIDGTDIAWSIIDETQAQPNGDFGFTRGTYDSVGLYNKTYVRENVKDALQELTKSETRPFDIEITHDKVVNMPATLGSNRPEIIFEFPGNIIELSLPSDATGLANQVIVFGADSNTGDVVAPEDDGDSQITYGLAQKLLSLSTKDVDSTLADRAQAELSAWSTPAEIPSIVVDGNRAPFITDYNIGDRVRVKFGKYDSISHINGMYRIEKYELTINEEDEERVNLYLSE